MTDAVHPHPFAFPDTALDDLCERETVDHWSQAGWTPNPRRSPSADPGPYAAPLGVALGVVKRR